MTTRQEVEAMVEKDGNMLLTSKAQVQEAWDAGARVYGIPAETRHDRADH